MFKIFKRKQIADDVDNNIVGKQSIKNTPPPDFDYDKAWKEGFVINVDYKFNPQEYADFNQKMYEHNNKILVYISIACVIFIAVITIATHIAFLNIKEPNFFTTTPSGHVQKLETHTNPHKLSRVPNDNHVVAMTKEYFAENMDKIQWFYGEKPKQLNLKYSFQSEGSEGNKEIELLDNGRIKMDNQNKQQQANNYHSIQQSAPKNIQSNVQKQINVNTQTTAPQNVISNQNVVNQQTTPEQMDIQKRILQQRQIQGGTQ